MEKFTSYQEIKKAVDCKMSALFEQCKVFFAFSNEQFSQCLTKLTEEEKTTIVAFGQGVYLPKVFSKQLTQSIENISKWKIEMLKNNNLVKDYILYELLNHECFYTYDLDDVFEKLDWIDKNEIIDVFHKNQHKYE